MVEKDGLKMGEIIAEFADELASANSVNAGNAEAEKTLPPRDKANQTRFDQNSSIMQIPLTIRVVVGSATLPVSALARIQRGALLPLDRKVGDKVDITANGRMIARGSIVICDETTSRYGVSIEEIAQMETN
jgi:flagellar motor switch protein FliN